MAEDNRRSRADSELTEEKQWVKVQKQTFTNWVNDRLKDTGLKVEDLRYQFDDGITLIKLLEVLAHNKKMPKYRKNPKLAIQKQENLTVVFKFIKEDEKIELVNIGPGDILEHNLKLVLGLVWTLIQRYQLGIGAAVEEEPPVAKSNDSSKSGSASSTPKSKPKKKPSTSAKKLLLSWVNSNLPDIQVTNLSSDWNDGIKISALVNSLKPGLIPNYSSLDPNNALSNTQNAMNLAEENFGIPQIIEPKNLCVPKPDELSVMTYLGYYCNKESPGKNSLLAWIHEKIPHKNITNFTSDWKDGTALACLADVVSGGQFPEYEDMSKEDPHGNATRAMDFAETLGVPKSITPEEFIEPSLDPLQLMTYLTHFKNVAPSADPLSGISAAGPGLTGDKSNKETNFVVRGRIPDWAPLEVVIKAPNGNKVNHQRIQTVPTSTVVKYTPVMPGTYVVEVKVNNEHIRGSPFTTHHQEPSNAKECSVGKPLEKAVVGEKSQVVVDCCNGGSGSLQAEVTGPNGRIGTDLVEQSDRVYAVGITPNEAGPHVLALTWGGTHIQGSPYTVNVVDPKKCIASGSGLANALVNEPATFKVQCQDAGQGVLDVNITGPSGEDVPVKKREDSPNNFVCTYTPKISGNYSIKLAWADYPVGSPFKVVATSACDPSLCVLKNVPTGNLRAGKEAKFIVDAANAGDATLQASGKGPSMPQECSIRPLESGVYEVSFTPFEVGTLDINIQYGDSLIPNMPLKFTVNDPTKCHVNAAAIEQGTYSLKEPISFRVSAQYAGEGLLSAELHGPPGTKKKPQVGMVSDGAYQIQFEPTTPGPHGISIFFDGEQIPNGLVKLFVDAYSGADDVIVTQPAPSKVGAYLVDTKYEYKVNAAGAKTGPLSATGNGIRSGNKPKIDILDNGNGQYVVGVVTDTPDEYHIAILWGGDAVPGSPFTISTVDAANASNVRVDGPHFTIGEPLVTMGADASNAGLGKLTAHCHGDRQGNVPVDIKENNPKKYDLSFKPSSCDSFVFSVLFSGEHVPGSPFKINTTPPDASKVKVTPPNTNTLFNRPPFKVDASNAGVGTLTASCSSKKIASTPVTIKEDAPGIYAVNYDSPVPDIYTLDIKWSDEHVGESPYEMNLYPVDASNVKVDGPHFTVGEPGVTLVADASGAGLGKLTANCRGHKQGTIPVEIKESQPNVYDLSVQPSSCDSIDLNVLFAGEHVSGSPFKINTTPPDASKVKVTPPNTNTLFNRPPFKVDASNAGVGTLTASCSSKKITSTPVTIKEDAPGIYAVNYDSPVPDIYTLDIKWSDEHVGESPYEMNLYPVDASNVKVDGPHFTVGEPGVTLVADASGAGLGKLTANCRGEKQGTIPVEIKESQPNVYHLSVQPSSCDSIDLNVLFAGENVSGSPFKINTTPPDASKVKVTPPNTNTLFNRPPFKVDASNAGVGTLTASCSSKKITSTPVTVKEDAPGIYAVNYDSPVPDIYTLDIKWSDERVGESPYEMNLYPVDAGKVKITKPYTFTAPSVSFKADTSVAGDGKLSATCTGKKTGPSKVSVEETSPFCYDIDISDLGSDVYTADITFDGVSVPESPFTLNLIPTDAGKVTVTPPDTFTVSMRAPFAVNASEAGDGELTAFCRADNSSNLPVEVKRLSEDEHMYKVSVTPIKEDKYHLTILWNKRDVPGSPFELNLIPPTYADRVVVDDPVFTALDEPVEASVDTSRAGPGKLSASCIGDKGTHVPVNITGVAGNQLLSFTPSEPDTYSLSVFYNDTPVPRSPLLVIAEPIIEETEFLVESGAPMDFDLPGMPDPAPARDTPTKKEPELDLEVGEALIIDIDVPKKPSLIDDGLSSSKPLITVSAIGDKTGLVDVSIDENDDEFHLEFNPSKPDRYVIDISCDGKPAPNSPVIVNYKTPYDASKCFITGLDKVPDAPLVNIPITFGVNASEAGKGELKVTSEGPSSDSTTSTVKVTKDSDTSGIYHVSYTPTAPGAHNVHVVWVDEMVQDSPLLFNVVSSSAISGEQVYPFGKPVTVQVIADCKAKQLEAHAVLSGTNVHSKLKVSKGPKKGVFNLSFQPSTPGFYDTFVKLNNRDVAGSPYRLQYADPPDPSKVKVTMKPDDVGYVNEPVEFAIDVTEGGISDLKLRVNIRKKAKDKRKAPEFKVSDYADGVYTGKFVPIHAADHQFEILYADEPVPGSPFSLPVKLKPPSINHILSSDLNLILVGKPVDVYFKLSEDDSVQSITTNVTGVYTDDAEVKIQTLEGQREYRAHFIPTNPDDYQVEVLHDKRQVPGSPFPVKVVGLGGFEQTQSPSDIENPPIIPVCKPFNLLLPIDYSPGEHVTASIEGPDAAHETVEVKDDNKGCYSVSYTPETPGEYLVNVKKGDDELNGSPFRIIVKETRSDPTRCFILEEDKPIFSKSQRFGKPVNFRISTSEAGPGTLNITSRGPGKADVRIFDNSNGTYTCEFTPSVAGKYHVDILWDDQHIGGSPYQLTFKEKKKKVITGLDLDVSNFKVNVPHRFKLHCEDIGTGTLQLAIKPPSAARITVSNIKDDSYQVEILPLEEGRHELSVTYGGNHIFGSPYIVTFNQRGDASKCRMISSDVEPSEDGHDHVIFIVSVEGAGQGKLAAHVDNPQSGERQQVMIEEIEPYVHKVHFDLGDGSEYQLVIKYDGEHIEGSPFKLLFADEVDASVCRAEGDGLTTSVVNKETSFVIHTEGAGEGEVKVKIQAEDGFEIGTQISNDTENEYLVKYTPTRPGKYNITVTFADEDIVNSPFAMMSYVPLHSSNLIVVNPTSEGYVGIPISYRVDVIEEMEEEGELQLRAKSRKTEVVGLCERDPDGGRGYKCTFEPSITGRYDVKIMLNGENITGSPFKTKVSDPPKPENVRVYGPGILDGYVGQEGNFTIETEAAGTGTMSVRVHGPKGAFKINMRRHPDNDRTILVRYDPKYTGQYKIDITWSDVHVNGSPFTVNINEQKDMETVREGDEENDAALVNGLEGGGASEQ